MFGFRLDVARKNEVVLDQPADSRLFSERPGRTSVPVTDAITQTNVKVLGQSTADAVASLYETSGQAVQMAAANAVYAQQQANPATSAEMSSAAQELLSLTGGQGVPGANTPTS